MSAGDLPMWTVYENPSDYPGKFVVRQFAIRGGVALVASRPTVVCETLEEARGHVPPGKCMIPRSVGDDPVIVEVWL